MDFQIYLFLVSNYFLILIYLFIFLKAPCATSNWGRAFARLAATLPTSATSSGGQTFNKKIYQKKIFNNQKKFFLKISE
jgi:hypothetical protein